MALRRATRVALGVLPLLVGIGLAIWLVVSARGDEAQAPADPGHATDPGDVRLDGRTFVSSTVAGHALVEGTAIRLAFHDDRLAVSAGCNTMSAPWAVTDGVLAWRGQPMTTLMGCAEERGAQDTWLTDLLTAGMTIVNGDAALNLARGEVSVAFDAVDDGTGR